MEITLNGEAKVLPPDSTVADLITDLGLAGKRLAVEVNLAIVPRARHETYPLQAGDKVEIVHAIGGG